MRFIISTAIATRDYQDVHHDRDKAQAKGSKDIFVNILTDTGLVQRYVGEWAGWGAAVRSCELRLGAPAHPGDGADLYAAVRSTIATAATAMNNSGELITSHPAE